MTTFADALRALIEEKRISQAELGRRVGVSAQSVSGWVTGSTKPSPENVVLIEDALAIDPRGELMRLTWPGYNADGQSAPTVESAIRADPGLDPEDKRVLLRVLAVLRKGHDTADAD